MTTYSTSRGAALERAFHHWRERGAMLESQASNCSTVPLTIAISRECGAGGSTTACAVAAKLDWPVYDRELVEIIAKDLGTRAQLLEELDEKQPHWLKECLESFSEEKSISGVGYAVNLRQVLLALYCHGNCVIVGRGAAQVLPTKRTLRVRLIAPRLYRVQRATDRLGISDDANREVTEIDRERTEFVKSYFHRDPTEVHDYDLTLDTSRFDLEQCCNLILTALQARRDHLSSK